MLNFTNLEVLLCSIFHENQTNKFNELLNEISNSNVSFSHTLMFDDNSYVNVKLIKYPDITKFEIKNNLNYMVFYV